jgi:hypothetical protein
MTNDTRQVSCCVVGGGPAGMMAGLLLARISRLGQCARFGTRGCEGGSSDLSREGTHRVGPFGSRTASAPPAVPACPVLFHRHPVFPRYLSDLCLSCSLSFHGAFPVKSRGLDLRERRSHPISVGSGADRTFWRLKSFFRSHV